jgi:sporulation protein YlmC with PRC-barrel domain
MIDFKSLWMTSIFLALIGSFAVAEDWLDPDPADPGPFEETYSDPWDTDYEADPWALGDEDPHEESRPDRFRVYDDRGHRTGRVERNPIRDDAYNLYDDRGRRTGRVERNPILEEDYTVYDDRGRRVREIRKNPITDGDYDVFDDRGRRVGRIRENPILDGQYDLYDDRGRRIGRVESD